MSLEGYKAYLAVLLGAIMPALTSCSTAPDFVAPSLSAYVYYVGEYECTLVGQVQDDLIGNYTMGFYYGTSPENMSRIVAESRHNQTTFNVNLGNLRKGTQYVYKAFINNGMCEICSEIQDFRTVSK